MFRVLALCAWVLCLVMQTAYALDPKAKSSDPQDVKPLNWSNLSSSERDILKPVEADWDRIAPVTQHKLRAASKHYGKMKPDEQARFQRNMPEWAGLTTEERNRARSNFKELKNLPPERKSEVKQMLRQKSAQQPAPASGVGASQPAAQQ
jgi:hypothetical protein